MRTLLSRLLALLKRIVDGDTPRDDLDDEIRSFLEHDIDSKIRSGMTPAEARRAALLELGGSDKVKERVWESAAGARVEGLFRDVRYAWRSLAQARGFAASVIGSLSLGLAATIITFALINGALTPQRFPGVEDQERLVTLGILQNVFGRFALRPTPWTDYPDIMRAFDEMSSLENVASFTVSDVAVTLTEPVSLPTAFVSTDYFEVLGVRLEIGRGFAPEESGPDAAVAIISHDLWMQEFGGDRSVIGQPIQAGRQPFQIIGVAPPGFAGTYRGADAEIWVPIAFSDLFASNLRIGGGDLILASGPAGARDVRQIGYIGRMRDGIRADRVQTELSVVAGGLVPATGQNEPVRVEVSGLDEPDATDVLEAFAMLAIPFLVLAIGCINAANLLLVRATRRRREVAVRLALGASRLRLVQQLIIESLILAVGAALLALPLAWSGIQWFQAFISVPFEMSLDATVLTGTLLTAFLTALAFGLVPAFQATRQHPTAALGTSHAGSGGTRLQSYGRRALVAGQVALSLGLLGTAFQLTSALQTAAQTPAADPDRILLASFDLEQLRYSSAESDAFYAALLDGASRLPGVEAAALSNRNLGLGWAYAPPAVTVSAEPDASIAPYQRSGYAGGDYFAVTGLDLVRGREFVAADRGEISEVAIVTERLAAQIFDGADALGRSVYVRPMFADERGELALRIVGVVKSPVDPSGAEVTAIFFPTPVQQDMAMTLQIRAAGPAAPLALAVRELVAQLDAQAPILELAPLDQKISEDNREEFILARAVALLGIIAVLLASLGLYGVTSYSVAIRAREFAVRIALGARRGRVLAMVMRQALSLVLIGCVVGGLAAIGIGQLIRAEILNVAAVDVAMLSGSAALLGLSMLLASLVPAQRAARSDPYSVLREE